MNLRTIIPVLTALICMSTTSFAAAGDVRPLEKTEAEKILYGMDYERVVVVAVIAGVHQKGLSSLNCATVIGLGRRDGKDLEIAQSFFFDRDLGWFSYELVPGKMRIWNRVGYSEAKL